MGTLASFASRPLPYLQGELVTHMTRRIITFAAVVSIVVLAFFALGSSELSADSKSKKAVTFSKDVAPIFFNSCAECHRPNDIAPMSLLSYKEARPWARSIK